MLTVNELLNVNPGTNAFEREAERERIENLFLELDYISEHEKSTLANELLAVVANPDELLLRRVQAAAILAHQARRLNIYGSREMGTSISKVLSNEYFPSSLTSMVESASFENAKKLRILDGVELLFVEFVTYALLETDYEAGQEFVKRVCEAAAASPVGRSVKELSSKAQIAAYRRRNRE